MSIRIVHSTTIRRNEYAAAMTDGAARRELSVVASAPGGYRRRLPRSAGSHWSSVKGRMPVARRCGLADDHTGDGAVPRRGGAAGLPQDQDRGGHEAGRNAAGCSRGGEGARLKEAAGTRSGPVDTGGQRSPWALLPCRRPMVCTLDRAHGRRFRRKRQKPPYRNAIPASGHRLNPERIPPPWLLSPARVTLPKLASARPCRLSARLPPPAACADRWRRRSARTPPVPPPRLAPADRCAASPLPW